MKASLLILFGVLIRAQAVPWMTLQKIKSNRSSMCVNDIIGGDVATRGQFPYQALVFAEDTGVTGAVLISPSAVLTVAHFVASHSRFQVHLGAQQLTNFDEPGRVIVNNVDVILHDKFQFGVNFDYDVAILLFSQPVTGPYFKPIRLPAKSQENTSFADMFAVASGWGTIDDRITVYSEELRYVCVRVTSLSECQSHWGDVVVTELNVCAATNGGSAGICVGDSGGPLAVTEEDGEPTLIGTAIFGSIRGCEKEEPNVYARMSKYLEWISQNVPDVIIRS